MNNQPNLKPFTIKGFFDISTGNPVSVELVKHIRLIKNPELLDFVKQNNISEVKKMLDEGCDPNIEGSNKRGCLEFAIDTNNLDMVKLLVNAGADIEKGNCGSYQMSALNYACLMKRKEIVEYLISIGADINNVDKVNDTPLHNACCNTVCPKIIRMLLEKGADYTKRNKDGKTPLKYAKSNDKKEAAKLIEDFIKSKEEKTVNTEKPSTINPENTVQPTVEVPKVVEKIKNPKLLDFVEQNNISEVKKMLDEGCDPNIQNDYRQGCLRIAIDNNNLDMIKLLVEFGVNIEEKNCSQVNKMSPLNYACLIKRKEIVEYLIGIGADINNVDRDNDTPLHNACRYNFCTEIIRMLLEKGADYTKRNKDGQTPLEFAKSTYKKEAAKLIEDFIKSKEEKAVKAENPNTANQETISNSPKNTNLVYLKLPLTSNSQPIDIQCCYEDAIKFLKEFNQQGRTYFH